MRRRSRGAYGSLTREGCDSDAFSGRRSAMNLSVASSLATAKAPAASPGGQALGGRSRPRPHLTSLRAPARHSAAPSVFSL